MNEEKVNEKLKELSKSLPFLKNCVISDIEGVAKSSEHLFYPLNKLTEIPKENFIHSENLTATDSRDIVFIDDLIGSGDQAGNYIKELKKEGKIGNQKLFYFAIVGLKDGINALEKSGLFETIFHSLKIQNKAFDTGHIFTAEESGMAKEMAFELGKQLTRKYLFCWGEIPGNDSERLTDFLKQTFSIDWVQTAKIEKIDNGKTIKVSTEKKSVFLKLNNEETKFNLTIDDIRNDELINTDKFLVKKENEKLNIYEKISDAGPLGYKNSQSLVFFGHNTPNNSLPIFWASGKCKLLEKVGESTEITWTPLFPRKIKPEPNSKTSAKNESSGANSKTNIPYINNTFFTGRQTIIKDLHEALNSKKTAAISQPKAISGLGGIGKTQTAVKYAYQYWDEYKYILWVNADSLETLNLDFAAIAKMLNLPNKDAKEQNLVINSVKLWLETMGEWLLIFDNADKPELIKDFFPLKPKGHILVTSRAQEFQNLNFMTPVELPKLESEESVEFLLKRTAREEVEHAEYEAIKQLAQEFDYLPLALEQAGAYISQRGSSFQEYLVSYHARGLKLLEQSLPITGKDIKADRNIKTVATTWSLNFDEVTKASPAAADLLYASAFLSHDNIPFEIIKKGALELGDVLSSSLKNIKTDPLIIEDILDPLTKFSLIHRTLGKSMYSIHRMVQVVLRDRMGETDQRMWSERVVKAVNCAFPEVEFSNWNTCDILLPHAKACSELIDKYSFENPEAANLLNDAGCYLRVRVRFEEAHPFFIRALEIRERIFKPESQEVAKSLNSLAGLFLDRGKYPKSEPLYKRAMEIREKILEPDHPDVAKSLSNLASLYRSQGKYAESEPLCKRALDIRERILKPDHPDVAKSLNNLALLYQAQGKYNDAEPLYKRALEIREKALGSDHPDVGVSLNNLAELYRDQGKYNDTEPLYKRDLEISEKALGSAHPDVATSLNNLAVLYQNQGKYDAAEPLLKRAVEISEKSLGSDHPDVAKNLSNLAMLYQTQEKYGAAEPLLKRALEINEKALGSAHPDVAKSLSNLAALYNNQGKFAKAAPLYPKAIEIAEKSLGEEHPDFLKYLINYRNVLRNIGTKTRELSRIQNRIKSIENKR